ncbi:MAG: Fur family transcriptional regulator [Mycoplasmatales bacterium]
MIVDGYIKILKDNGLKITKQRKTILEIFCSNQNSLISAKHLREILLTDYQMNLSFDTIYKNIHTLVDLKIISEKIIDKQGKYILKTSFKDQHVFICLNCGKTIQIDDNCSHGHVMKNYPTFMVKYHNLELFGYCNDCHHVVIKGEKINNKPV